MTWHVRFKQHIKNNSRFRHFMEPYLSLTHIATSHCYEHDACLTYMDPVNPHAFTFFHCFKIAAYTILRYLRKDLTVAPLERVHQSTRAAPFYEGMCVSKQRDCLSLCQAMQHIWIHLNAVLTRLLAISVVSSGQVVNTFTFTTVAVRTRLRPVNKTRPSFYIWSSVVAKQELNKSELKSLPAGVMGTKLSQSSPAHFSTVICDSHMKI